MVASAFDPSTREAEKADPCESEVSLLYRVSSRTVMATWGNPVFKKENCWLLSVSNVCVKSCQSSFAEVGSFSPSSVRRLNAGHQAWWQVPLPTEAFNPLLRDYSFKNKLFW